MYTCYPGQCVKDFLYYMNLWGFSDPLRSLAVFIATVILWVFGNVRR